MANEQFSGTELSHIKPCVAKDFSTQSVPFRYIELISKGDEKSPQTGRGTFIRYA